MSGDHVLVNRASWDEDAPHWVERGRRSWASEEPFWAIWCDPYRWIPEAARILRPGGRLIFVAGASVMMLCFPTDDDNAPADTTLHRDYFGMHRFEWRNEDGIVDSIEFHLGHGEMIRL